MDLKEVGCEDAECSQLAHEKVTHSNESLGFMEHKYFVKVSSSLISNKELRVEVCNCVSYRFINLRL